MPCEAMAFTSSVGYVPQDSVSAGSLTRDPVLRLALASNVPRVKRTMRIS